MRLPHLIIAILLAAALALPALAAPRDPDLPRLDGKNEWHMIGPTAKTTQSKCIGQTTTPVCAIETAEACLIRHNDRLCRIASGPLKSFRPAIQVVRSVPEQYRVHEAFRINEGNVPPWELTAKQHLRHIGDIEIVLDIRRCDALQCNSYGDENVSYVLRRVGGRWAVVGRVDCWAADVGHASHGPCSVGWPHTTR